MNFYKHYIGDYQRDTSHLSFNEHAAYRLMLDVFYATEQPLPSDRVAIYRMLRALSQEEQAAVDSVLSQFWKETDDGFINPRASEEISKATAQRDTNKRITEERERKRKERKAKDGSKNDASHEPKTNRSTKRVTSSEPNQTPDSRLSSVSDSSLRSESSTGADAPDCEQDDLLHIPLSMVRPPGGDWSRALFRQGLAWLASVYETGPDKQRPLVGQWLKKAEGDHKRVFELLAECESRSIADPKSWVAAALDGKQEKSEADKWIEQVAGGR